MEFKISIADQESTIDQVKQLFFDYGVERSFDKALGDYQKEINELPGRYQDPAGILLLAQIENEPAGCIAYQQLDATTCEMKRMYVRAKYRNQGLGQKLIEHLITLARQSGYFTMKLDSHPSMLAAQKLYRKFGFYPASRYNNNPIEGILFFEKKLK